jgi:hypothetical protein
MIHSLAPSFSRFNTSGILLLGVVKGNVYCEKWKMWMRCMTDLLELPST